VHWARINSTGEAINLDDASPSVQVELGTLHTASTSFARLQLVCNMIDECMTAVIGLLKAINHVEDQQGSMTGLKDWCRCTLPEAVRRCDVAQGEGGRITLASLQLSLPSLRDQ